MSVNSCTASFPLGLGWGSASDGPLGFLPLSTYTLLFVHLHQQLQTLSDFVVSRSVLVQLVLKSLGVVHSVWDKPAAGRQCGTWLTSSLLHSGLGDSFPSTRAFPWTGKPGKWGDVPSMQVHLPALSSSQQKLVAVVML